MLINHKNIKLFIMVINIMLFSGFVSAQYHVQRNTAYIEFLGVSEFYSLNLDHIINEFHHNSETVRIGFSYRPKNSVYISSGLNLMHGFKKKKDRYFEAGFGGVYAYRFANQPPHDAFGYLTLGYRKQGTKKDPLFWKVAFTPLIARAPKGGDWLGWFLPSVGGSVGYSF